MHLKTRTWLIILLLSCLSFVFLNSSVGVWGSSFFVLLIFLSSLPICARHLGKIRFLFVDLFLQPIIINAIVSVRFGLIRHFNLGDDLNWFLVKRMQKRSVSLLGSSILGRFCNKKNYLVIGSTIALLSNNKTVIWGAGAIDGSRPLKGIPQKVCAVRGPLTRRYLLERGVDCPPIYGDPALLMKYFYKPLTGKKYKLGIIPHYTDFSSKKFCDLKKDQEILFIQMRDYKSVQTVINQIASCEKIISSSLHGLILSETYDIPNVWIKVSDNIDGGSFKYQDYYESIGITDAKPYLLKGNETKNQLLGLFAGYRKGRIDLKPLIMAAPFELNIKSEDIT
jgi:pyruvyltransferase